MTRTMNNIMKLLIIVVCFAGVVFFVWNDTKQTVEYGYSDDYVQIKELPDLLDFCYYSKKEWEDLLTEQDFGEVVTADTVLWILEQTGSSGYIDYEKGNEAVLTRKQWREVYSQLLDLLDEDDQITVTDEVILKQEKETLTCASGTYTYKLSDIKFTPMTAMGFYIKDNAVIGIAGMQSETASLCNVYVEKAEADQITFLSNRNTYTLDIVVEQPAEVENHICDLLWQNGVIAKVQVKGDTIQGNLISLNEHTIEIEGYGEIARAENLPVYKTYGSIEQKDLSDIVIANMKVEYVVAGESVEAVLLREPAQLSKIRVLLLADDGTPYRENIYIGADSAYQILQKEGTADIPPETVSAAGDLFANIEDNSLQLKPTDESGELYICDAAGTRLSYGYKGSIELRRYPEGYVIVNELPIEEYLCAVVPSEMPAAYEVEALKAQAVCARSYAYIQLERGDYAAFGAHVDDSTNYQVYNKKERDEKTSAAVLDTAGKVIHYQGKIAEAYYFSTSSGITGNGEAWNLAADSQYGYLRNTLVKEGGGEPDLSTEEAFSQFLADSDETAYEAAMPYYRWRASADYTSKQTQKKIKSILRTRKMRTPEDIIYMDSSSQVIPKMKKFGNLTQLAITKRSTGGVALQLALTYEHGTVLIGNEYNIRAVLGAGLTSLTLADGTNRDSTLLPSAYATIVPVENETYVITGGGYGHGIGMSQNGADAMAAMGKSWEEILNFFFKDIEITNVT